MSRRLLAGLLLTLVGLGLSGPALAHCQNYAVPGKVSREEFLTTDFGSLGLRYGTSRLLLLDRAGCYDVSHYGLRSAIFDLNSTGAPQAAYFAAAVTRTFPSQTEEVAPHRLELHRNSSSKDRADKWLRVTDDEAEIEAGTQLNGSEFGVLRAGYESGILTDAYEPRATDLTEPAASGRWHAVLGILNGPRSAQVNVPVIANSRVGINSLTAGLDGLLDAQGGPAYTKIYLNKFLVSPSPSLNEPFLNPGSAECMYITHGIGGLDELSLTDSLDTIVLKFGTGDC